MNREGNENWGGVLRCGFTLIERNRFFFRKRWKCRTFWITKKLGKETAPNASEQTWIHRKINDQAIKDLHTKHHWWTSRWSLLQTWAMKVSHNWTSLGDCRVNNTYLESFDFNEFFQPIHNEDVTIRIMIGNVSRMQPTLLNCLDSGFVIVQISFHDLGSSNA